MSPLEPAVTVIQGVGLPENEDGSAFLTGWCLPSTALPENLPSSRELERWLLGARGALEWVLADYDAQLLRGLKPSVAARFAVSKFVRWVGASSRSFSGVDGVEPSLVEWFLEEAAQWDGLAQECSNAAEDDLGAVDRFLGLYLSMAHQLMKKGCAQLLKP